MRSTAARKSPAPATYGRASREGTMCSMTRALSGDVTELQRARAVRLANDRAASMSERLARAHALCKQLSAIKGVARAPR